MDHYAAIERAIASLLMRKTQIDSATAQLLSNDIMRMISLAQANTDKVVFPNNQPSR